jgi:translocation and assembly module TamA
MPPLPRLRLAALAVAFLMLSPAALAQPAPEVSVRYRVELDAPRDLRQVLSAGISLNRWENDPDMTAQLLQRLVEEALAEVREAVATRGWYSPRVNASIDRTTDPWTVRIAVDPGERTLVRTVDVSVTGPAASDPEAARLIADVREKFTLHAGQAFEQDAWRDAKNDAARRLATWRYAAARVARSEARVDPAAREAALTVVIDSGPPFVLGDLVVSGAKRYPERVVTGLSPVNPGETYDREKLRVFERRLQESGYFVSAQASVEPDPSLAQAAPVRIVVIEGQPRTVETVIGYNTDTALNTRVRLRNQDLFGTAWRLGSELRYDNKVQSLRADLDSPPRTDGSWNNHFASVREADIQKETTRELALGFAHNWGWESTPSALLVSGHVEEQTVQAFGDAGATHEKRHALFFGWRHVFRHTDDLVAPRAGYQGTLSIGGAPPEVSTREFTRATAKLLAFVPLGRRDDLLLRAEAGYVLATSRLGIPSTFLFRTGGDQSVRGYAFESIGVRQGDAVVGGRRMAILSAEAIHWIGDAWGVAGFVDAGDAWDSSERGFHANVGYGIGGRVRTPIGPVRADLAYGHATRKARLHFSVGFTF